MVMSDTVVTDSVDSIIDALPAEFTRGRGRYSLGIEQLVTETGPLTDEHVKAAREFVASGRTLGVSTPNLKSLRNSHHRLAQLLAGGMSDIDAARLCNFNANRIAHLRRDPAFQELLSHYAETVESEFKDFVSAAAELSEDFLGELRDRLDNNPEQFTPATILEAVRTLADRSGNAPVSRTVNVNVFGGLGEKLAQARKRVHESRGEPAGPTLIDVTPPRTASQ